MSKFADSSSHGSRMSDWFHAEMYVKQWQVNPTDKNRELASKHVYGAMLRDAIGMVFLNVDTFFPHSLRRDQHQMEDDIMQSIFARNRFTVMVNGHQNDGPACLRTYLNKRIRWKLRDHFRRDKRNPLMQLDIPMIEIYSEDENEDYPSQQKEQFAKDDQAIVDACLTIDRVFTLREKMVMACYVEGLTNEEGAVACELSLATYKRTKSQALSKSKVCREMGI